MVCYEEIRKIYLETLEGRCSSPAELRDRSCLLWGNFVGRLRCLACFRERFCLLLALVCEVTLRFVVGSMMIVKGGAHHRSGAAVVAPNRYPSPRLELALILRGGRVHSCKGDASDRHRQGAALGLP